MKTLISSILGALGLLVAVFFYGKSSGKNKEQAKQDKEQLNELQKANTASFNARNRSNSERKRRMLQRNSKQ